MPVGFKTGTCPRVEKEKRKGLPGEGELTTEHCHGDKTINPEGCITLTGVSTSCHRKAVKSKGEEERKEEEGRKAVEASPRKTTVESEVCPRSSKGHPAVEESRSSTRSRLPKRTLLRPPSLSKSKMDPLKEAKYNFKSLIGTQYTDEVVREVWKGLSEWTGDCVANRKAVVIKNLGTFTLSRWRLDTGIRKELLISNPAFVLASKLVQYYKINQRKDYIDQKIPVLFPNYAAIAKKIGIDRTAIEYCVNEVVECICRLLSEGEDMGLEFPGMGRLDVKGGQACFTFTEEFKSRITSPSRSEGKRATCRRADFALSPPWPDVKNACRLHNVKFELKKV